MYGINKRSKVIDVVNFYDYHIFRGIKILKVKGVNMIYNIILYSKCYRISHYYFLIIVKQFVLLR